MPDLLRTLKKHKLLEEYIDDLDWYLNGKHFSSDIVWNKTRKASFTRKINKKFEKSERYEKGNQKDLCFEKASHHSKRIHIFFTDGNGVGASIIKHIRNGIAHGNCSVYFPKGEPFIEIYDFNSKKDQTAYMYFPLRYVHEIADLYKITEKE